MILRIVILLVLASGIGFWYWTTTPEYSMREVRAALKNHDLAKFAKYVDTDSVASYLVEDLIGTPVKQVLGQGVLGQCLVGGVMGFFKEGLVKSIKQQINHYVETGKLAYESHQFNQLDQSDQQDSSYAITFTSNQQSKLSLTMLDSRLGFRKLVYKGIAYNHQEADKHCTLGLLLHNEPYNADLILDIKMRQCEGYWKIVQLSNFPAFTGKLIELEVAKAKTAP